MVDRNYFVGELLTLNMSKIRPFLTIFKKGLTADWLCRVILDYWEFFYSKCDSEAP